MKPQQPACQAANACLHRRQFLATTAGGMVATMLLSEVFPDRVLGQDQRQLVQVATYPRKRIAALSNIPIHQPIEFHYPNDDLHTGAMLVRLGRKAGGGIGPDQDIVAFSTRCTHMGGDMSDGYLSAHGLLGCGEHLTTFDLTRHGMLAAGHATESLPQIILELVNHEIFATGIVGLLYGYSENPTTEQKGK